MKFLCVGIVVTIFLVVHTDAWWKRRRRRSPPPPPPCKVSPWSSWSKCNHKCGNAGLQTRNKYDCCSGTCRETMKETRLCNRNACRNGGKPLNGRCSCRGGYTGTCCETGEYLPTFRTFTSHHRLFQRSPDGDMFRVCSGLCQFQVLACRLLALLFQRTDNFRNLLTVVKKGVDL